MKLGWNRDDTAQVKTTDGGKKMLELEHISFEVAGERGEKEILKDVSFVLPDNKFVVITGPNGGGKSTLQR